MQAGIVGLGLIGGSLGLALKETRLFKNILGYDVNPLHQQQALNLGLIDECVSLDEISSSDVIFIAVPLDVVATIINGFKNIAPNQTIIDLGSTKSLIASLINSSIRKNYVGAHPMSGTEYSGPKAAKKDLFKNNILILTDTEQSGEFQIAFTKDIFVSLGMQIIKMNSYNHDAHIAYISHLPHILSFALANTVLGQEKPENILALIGGGFRDTSRLSKSSPITWCNIFKHNKTHLLESISEFEKNIALAKTYIKNEEWDKLENWMRMANSLYEFL
ncbi:prephenate dehydrogenase [Helicobacter muridarum]|uniref:Prephenate dehydrogenase n=1 Tax=Helicobacter muridarum TaxID=216 RepID=A0A099TWQ2_9HELI|nr:prephenate dehydrogenase [Helicobacter muridarum]TLE01578.1 prephenate dehydrogenase [Helicobacter muridarum]STQ86188.1 prephenate dehydrogenase [Helicobacter muridarum]